MTDNVLFPPENDVLKRKIEQAQEILRSLNFDRKRTNIRSALTLLSLLGHRPETPWSESGNELMTTRDIMDRMRDDLGREYAANSRETIRRETLHQFVNGGLVEHNPDDPERAINSKDNCYRVHPRALRVVQSFCEAEFNDLLKDYLANVPGIVADYVRAKELHRIPVTLPSGHPISLSPGGQNVLLRDMVEVFCPQFTPGGQVLYVGDADTKWAHFESEAFAAIGIAEINKHGKMPDLVVYMADKNWLVLLEAVTSHGPVDAKRRGELAALFAQSIAGLVYVSCFPSREIMRKYLTEIAWETEIWCADSPTHLIHFNGERFLGPYG